MKDKKQTISTFFFLTIGIAIIISVLFLVAKERKRATKIQQEISALGKEAAEIERRNNALKEKISYLSTENFYKREAKEKLNYQKEGEQVVIIRRPIRVGEPKNDEIDVEEVKIEEPNYKIWWRYFFTN